MNSASAFNQLRLAWSLYHPNGGLSGGDVARAGRGFSPLEVGQASSDRQSHHRGHTIVLSHGTDNIAYGYAGSQIEVGTFESFSYRKWYTSSTWGGGRPKKSLIDTEASTLARRLGLCRPTVPATSPVTNPTVFQQPRPNSDGDSAPVPLRTNSS